MYTLTHTDIIYKKYCRLFWYTAKAAWHHTPSNKYSFAHDMYIYIHAKIPCRFLRFITIYHKLHIHISYICIYLWIRMTFSTIPWMPACLFLGSFWTFKAKNMVETISAAYANAPILDHITVALKGLEGACSDPRVVQLGSWTNIGK